MKVTIEIELPDDYNGQALAWSLRDVANRFARGTIDNVDAVWSPGAEDIGTVVIT